MRPAVGSASLAIMRRSVDLPHPDGPRIAMNSPAAISRSMPAITTSLSKALRTPCSCRATPPEGCSGAPLFDDRLGDGLVLVGIGNAHGDGCFAGAGVHLEAIIVFLGIGQTRGGFHYFPFATVHRIFRLV